MTEGTPGTAAQVRQLFDAKAATWSEKYAAGGRLTGRLARLAPVVLHWAPPGGSVLDLGCGTGDLARHLAATGLRVTGCDISVEMLDRAAQADQAGTVKWATLDPGWCALPFPPETFNAIVASSVLEYVDDPLAVLRECFRLLKPGGSVHCTVPDLRHPVRWLERMVALSARVPITLTLSRRLPRLDSYLAYLRISQQRHSLRWWTSVASRACMTYARQPAATSERLPLRLLSFQKSAEMRNGS